MKGAGGRSRGCEGAWGEEGVGLVPVELGLLLVCEGALGIRSGFGLGVGQGGWGIG